MKPIAGKLAFNGVLILLSALMLTQAYQLPSPSVANVPPAFFPKAICWLLVILGSLILTQDLLKARRQGPADTRVPTGRSEWLASTLSLLGLLLLLTAYIQVLEPWGYLLSTGLFLLLTALLLGAILARPGESRLPTPKGAGLALAFSVIATGILYVVFGELFNLALP